MTCILIAAAGMVTVLCHPVREGPHRTLWSWLQLGLFVGLMGLFTAVACYLVS